MTAIERILIDHSIIIWNGYVLSVDNAQLKPLSDFSNVHSVLVWLGY